jgi:beta-glucuronidase
LERWSPESPTLHELRITSPTDDYSDQVGLRTIETSGPNILLNGERVFLRGICLHEEVPFGQGRGWSEDHARTLLGWAKELGCNFVRLAHYTHNESIVRLADEMGLLVWAEIPVYWKLEYDNPQTLEDAKTHLRAMIARDHSRASVIIWSIGNETREEESSTRFRTALAHEARRLDSSRLLSAALLARQERSQPGLGQPGSAGARLNRMVIDDPFAEHVDLLAINQYIGWYHDRPDEIGPVEVVRIEDKPVIISEFGADALFGHRGPKEQRWTEEYQAWLFEHTLQWAEGIEGIAGVSPWILRDFRSPRRQLPAIQDFWNRKGVLSDQGERKLAWFVLKKYYDRWEASPPGD